MKSPGRRWSVSPARTAHYRRSWRTSRRAPSGRRPGPLEKEISNFVFFVTVFGHFRYLPNTQGNFVSGDGNEEQCSGTN